MGQPATTDIVTLFKALADERRIKIIATLIGHGRSLDEIAAAVNLPRARVAGHLGVLQQVGLVEADGQPTTRYYFRPRPLHDALRGMAELPKQTDFGGDLTDYDQKVLGTYLVEGRLKAIPAQQKKRDVILRFLADQFESGRMYGEKEVNEIILRYHDDYASLRRYLVDTNLLERQIVRVVETEALMRGDPQVAHRNMYWKPDRAP